MNKNKSLGDVFLHVIVATKELLEMYEETGPAGAFAAAELRHLYKK